MRKQSAGFGAIEIIGVLLAGAALVWAINAGIGMVKGYLEDVRATADRAGYDRAIKQTAQRDKAELIGAQVQIAALTLERDTQAALHTEEQARLKKKRDKELADAKTETAELQRRIDSGELVLRDPGRGAGPGGAGEGNAIGGGRSGEGQAVAAAALGSGQGLGVGLSKPFARFLVWEADRADEVAKDLELCWGIARDDRKQKP